MRRTITRFLALALSAALLLSCAPALAAEGPKIPIGDDLKEYEPDRDGYYALLPVRYEPPGEGVHPEGQARVTKDIYLPVLVYQNTVYVSKEDFIEISGTHIVQASDPRCCLLGFQLREVFLFADKTHAIYVQGNWHDDGQAFANLSLPLSAAPMFIDDVLWLPLDDVALIFGMDPSVQGEGEDKIYQLFRPERDALDVLANLTTEMDFWTSEFDFWDDEGAQWSSASATYLDNLLHLDPTTLQMLVKQCALTDLWASGFLDDSQEDWVQMLTTDVAEMLVLAGADEAFEAAQRSFDASSELLSVAQTAFQGRAQFTTDVVKPLLGKFRDKEAVKRLGKLIGQMEDPINAKALKDISDVSGQVLTVAGGVLSFCGNVAAFEGRDALGQETLTALLDRASFRHTPEVCVETLRKNLKEYQKTAAQYALGKTLREEGISTVADFFSLTLPPLTVYKLASELFPPLAHMRGAALSFQDAMVAAPLQYDAQAAAESVLAHFNGADFTPGEMREALLMSYIFMKSCYVTTKLAKQSIPDRKADTSRFDQKCDQLLGDLAILSNAYSADDSLLPGNLSERFAPLSSGAPYDLVDLAKKMYYTVYGEVREKDTEKPVKDARCEITANEKDMGWFEETPEGKYEVNIPVYEPEGILSLTPSALVRDVELTFSSKTVEGEDSVKPEFDPGERVEAETAYLDWVTPQLKLIAKQRSVWQGAIPDWQRYYNYSITDMNNNHRLEITVAYMMGTGHFTDWACFEVNDDVDALVEVTRGEGAENAPDVIIDGPVDVYRDGKDYVLIRYDGLRNGWAEYMESWYAWTLHDRVVDVIYLCGRYTRHYQDKPDEITCYDTEANVISASELEGFTASRYAGLPKGSMTFGWRSYDALTGDIVAALRDSWEDFGCDLFEEE